MKSGLTYICKGELKRYTNIYGKVEQIEIEAHKLGERLDFLRVSHEKLTNKIQNMNKGQDFTVEEFEKMKKQISDVYT